MATEGERSEEERMASALTATLYDLRGLKPQQVARILASVAVVLDADEQLDALLDGPRVRAERRARAADESTPGHRPPGHHLGDTHHGE